MRKKWVGRLDVDGSFKLIPIEDCQSDSSSSHVVHQDTMDKTWNPLTKKYYDSKSAYARDTKAAGGTIMGNDYKRSDGTIRNDRRIDVEPVKKTLERIFRG
jgi:hypothetical protein